MAHILIVDDEPDIRTLLARFMERFGHTADLAANGEEGIEKVKVWDYDLILTDIRMPGVDGLGFLREIRDRVVSRTPCMIITAFDDVRLAIEATRLGVCNFLVKPFDGEELRLAVQSALDLREGWSFRHRHEEKLQEELRDVLRVFLREVVMQLDTTGEAGDHCKRVSEWTVMVAKEMGVTNERSLLDIQMGALLHDIGKVRVGREILLKPGPLDDEQWEEMRRHPEYGVEMIRGIPRLARAVTIVQNHHERFSGGGYPRGIRGEEIPLEARIFSVVDAFDCMLEKRSYKSEIPPEEALAELKRHAGTQFDPAVVEVFERQIYGQIVDRLQRNGGSVPVNGQITPDLHDVARGLTGTLAEESMEEARLKVNGNGNGNGTIGAGDPEPAVTAL